MRLYEIESTTYYFLSEEAYQPDTEVTPPPRIMRYGAVIEGLLERGRPDHCLPRAESIILHTSRSSNALYIYEVEPIGSVERYHSSWLRLLASGGSFEGPQVADWVSGYWSGTECPSMPGNWEYRAPAVRIVELLGGKAARKGNSSFDWMKAVHSMKQRTRNS